jgi:hypothetical protein
VNLNDWGDSLPTKMKGHRGEGREEIGFDFISLGKGMVGCQGGVVKWWSRYNWSQI